MEYFCSGVLFENIPMAAINNPPPSQKRKAGVQRLIKHHLKIDMTPMVDLGFLLITFFVITTELAKPTIIDLYLPKDGQPTDAPASKSITFLTGSNDKIFYYYGEEKDAALKNHVIQTSWDEINGVGKIIREKQLQLDHVKGGRNEMVIIIKPGKESTYRNVVDLLDEMSIHGVKKYAVVKVGDKDSQFLAMYR